MVQAERHDQAPPADRYGGGPAPEQSEVSGFSAALAQVAAESLKHLARGLAVIYSVFALFHFLELPTGVKLPIVFSDLVMLALAVFLATLLKRARPGFRAVNLLAASIGILVFLHTLLIYLLAQRPPYEIYVVIVTAALGFFILSSRWLAGATGLIFVVWLGVLWPGHTGTELLHWVFAMLAASTISWIVHLSQLATQRRIYESLEAAERKARELERAEESLRRNEQQYHAVFDASITGLMIRDLESGRLIAVNPAAARMFGYSQEELLGLEPKDYIHPDSLPLLDQMLETVSQDRKFSYSAEVIHKKGGTLSVSGFCVPFGVAGERMSLGIISDVTDQNTLLERLKASEASYRSLIEDQSEFIVKWKPDGTRTFVNEAYCRYFKQEREVLVGTSFMSLVSEEHREAVRRKLASLSPEEPAATDEHLVLMPNGTKRWHEWTDRGHFDEKGELIELHSVGRDIHERKRVREALQASEHRFRDLFQNSPDAIFVEDLEGVVLDVNPMACRLHGLERQELIGRSFIELVPHQLRESARRDFDRIAKGSVAAVDGFSFASDGRAIPVGIRARHIDYGGEPALLLHVRDVTEQRQAEEALRDSEERYRALFESSRDAIYTSRLDGGILDINAAAVKLFEFDSREQLLTANVREFYRDPEERDSLLGEISKSGYVQDYELQLVSRTGKALTALLTATAILDENEAVAGFRGILRDVTEQRMLESQFRQAQKMEAVGRLAGGVAHDFNNLLTVITGYSELCLEQTAPQDPRREELLEIQGASERAAKLTRQLLAFSRQQVLRPRVLDLNSVVADFEKLLKRTIGEDIRFETSLAPALGKARVDPGQIEQVLMNLAINARDAMPGGGRLFLETENVCVDEENSSHKTTMESGPYVVLILGDTGCGMDEETRNRIFEPFFTTKQGRGGTGLGLATVYGIVKQSGGYIWVYSEPEQGTVFKIYFPEVREAVEQPPPPIQDLDKDLVGGTILVVEDELPVRSLVARVLEDQGFQVLATDDPEEAVRILKQHQDPLELLITDLVMPGMSGLALLEHLVEHRPGMRAIMMSGYSKRSRFQGTGLPAGLPFLAKPFSARELTQLVQQTLRSKQVPWTFEPAAKTRGPL